MRSDAPPYTAARGSGDRVSSDAARRRTGYLFVVGSSLLWSTNGLISRLVFDSGAIAPRQFAALRIYGAALLLAPLVIAARPVLSRREWRNVALFGVFGVSLPQWLYFEAIARIPVPIALVIVYTAPALLTAYERIVHGHRLSGIVYTAIAVAVVGVILAVTGGKGGAGALAIVGVLLAVATTFAYAGQIVVASIQPPHLHPMVRTGLGMAAGCLFWMVLSPIWRMPFGRAADAIDLGPRLGATLPLWVLALYVMVCGTAVPYALLVAGSPRIGAGASSVTGMVEPVAASVLAWVLLNQVLEPIQIVGIVIGLLGVTVAEVWRTRHLSRNAPTLAVSTGT
jgi:drug/metabolite transporter (DMT)-like permease